MSSLKIWVKMTSSDKFEILNNFDGKKNDKYKKCS